ncbi:hypothetical protein GC105_00810 [Alkalibaculum sp. M08DMB]|uniref:Uncharacterized protein n=1 Tax=Alkalibaculum sporogenes TaxID=2655001 RepID=A0A6A7K5B5_9FIRM|nr:hypothetical protein [Alkalibaculum sporogenes]MPW24333.1 hypothetical protein [Alkalibaculum sporogenes]
MNKYYMQSLTSIELGYVVNKKELVYNYEDYAIYEMLRNFTTEELNKFCHPSILKLVEYDSSNKTEFLNTLYVYLENSKKNYQYSNCSKNS